MPTSLPHPTDLWTSILWPNHNQRSRSDPPPPYIHPTIKRSATSLSTTSLDICTESLGSETGSDGFSQGVEFGSDPPARKKNGYSYIRPALPPPLPSPSMRFRSRRHDGRLVMEAVALAPPAKRYLRAERENGRLLLTCVRRDPSQRQPGSNSLVVGQEEIILHPVNDDVAGGNCECLLLTCARRDPSQQQPGGNSLVLGQEKIILHPVNDDVAGGNCKRLLLTCARSDPSQRQPGSNSLVVGQEEIILHPVSDDVAEGNCDVARVGPAGGLRPYVYKYGRYNKLRPCKRTVLLSEPLCIVTS